MFTNKEINNLGEKAFTVKSVDQSVDNNDSLTSNTLYNYMHSTVFDDENMSDFNENIKSEDNAILTKELLNFFDLNEISRTKIKPTMDVIERRLNSSRPGDRNIAITFDLYIYYSYCVALIDNEFIPIPQKVQTLFENLPNLVKFVNNSAIVNRINMLINVMRGTHIKKIQCDDKTLYSIIRETLPDFIQYSCYLQKYDYSLYDCGLHRGLYRENALWAQDKSDSNIYAPRVKKDGV